MSFNDLSVNSPKPAADLKAKPAPAVEPATAVPASTPAPKT